LSGLVLYQHLKLRIKLVENGQRRGAQRGGIAAGHAGFKRVLLR